RRSRRSRRITVSGPRAGPLGTAAGVPGNAAAGRPTAAMTPVIVAAAMTAVIGWRTGRRLPVGGRGGGGTRPGTARADGVQRGPAHPAGGRGSHGHARGRRPRAGAPGVLAALLSRRQGATGQRGGRLGGPVRGGPGGPLPGRAARADARRTVRAD